MPRKVRCPKRRIGDEAEARAWQMFFKAGHDYLGDLRPFGIESDKEAGTAAPDAWRRFGRAFMADWLAHPSTRVPWAISNLGEP